MLGKSPSWQDADGACSGYLLEDGDTAVLLDCGNAYAEKVRSVRNTKASCRSGRRPRSAGR